MADSPLEPTATELATPSRTQYIPLLPPPEKLALLPPESQAKVIDLTDRINVRNAGHAREALRLGTFSLLACIAGFMYMVQIGHPKSAGVVLGTGVLTIILQIINSRV